MRNMFGKPVVRVESDEQSRGTTFRTCSVVIEAPEVSRNDLVRIRAALAPLMRNAEVSLVGRGNASLIDKTAINRIRINYYGMEAVPAERIVEAVRSVL